MTIIASLLPMSAWFGDIDDFNYAVVLDRFVDNAHRVELSGERPTTKFARKAWHMT